MQSTVDLDGDCRRQSWTVNGRISTSGDCKRKKTQIPKPSYIQRKERTEQYCLHRNTPDLCSSLFMYATTTPVEIGTCTSEERHQQDSAVQNVSTKRHKICDTAEISTLDNNCSWLKYLDADSNKAMNHCQFPESLQALFLSEKGLKKFEKIIQDQINYLRSQNVDAKCLPPISHYKIVKQKAKSDTNICHSRRLEGNNQFVDYDILFGSKIKTGSIHSTTSGKSTSGLLQVDEIKKDLVTVCAYIFKQTKIINELWKYLENNASCKHQLNGENIKTITAGALSQHLSKLHGIRENLFSFNEKYRADLNRRIHLLRQISKCYSGEASFLKLSQN